MFASTPTVLPVDLKLIKKPSETKVHRAERALVWGIETQKRVEDKKKKNGEITKVYIYKNEPRSLARATARSHVGTFHGFSVKIRCETDSPFPVELETPEKVVRIFMP